MSEAPTPPETTASDSEKSAASDFLAARLELIRLEAREAGARAVRQIALLVVAALAAFFFWVLAMAGLIGWIAAGALSWWVVTLIVAGVHLAVAVIAILIVRSASGEQFSLTRSELLKDRQWLDRILKKTQNSSR